MNAMQPDPCTITISRIIDAPPELVFRMWTEPDHVEWWFGPRGFRTTIHAMDVRPGGHWRFTMHGPDGTDYPNDVVYRIVEPPNRLAYTHLIPRFDMEVRLAAEDGKTRLIATSTFPSAAECRAAVEKYGAVDGLTQTVGRLGELAGAQTDSLTNEPTIVMTHRFAAPRDLVFRAHTDPAMMQRWWGPHGYENLTCEIDLRPGGKWRVEQRAADGALHDFHGVYREIDAPGRLVATFVWGGKPDEELVTVTTFSDDGDGTSVTSITSLPSIADRDRMLGSGATGGAMHGFERLEMLLDLTPLAADSPTRR